jgi:hypothetical protein
MIPGNHLFDRVFISTQGYQRRAELARIAIKAG